MPFVLSKARGSLMLYAIALIITSLMFIVGAAESVRQVAVATALLALVVHTAVLALRARCAGGRSWSLEAAVAALLMGFAAWLIGVQEVWQTLAGMHLLLLVTQLLQWLDSGRVNETALSDSDALLEDAQAQVCLFHLLGAALLIALLGNTGAVQQEVALLLGWTTMFSGLYGLYVVRELAAQSSMSQGPAPATTSRLRDRRTGHGSAGRLVAARRT